MKVNAEFHQYGLISDGIAWVDPLIDGGTGVEGDDSPVLVD